MRVLIPALVCSAAAAFAGNLTGIEITDAYIRETPKNARSAAAYMTIHNMSDTPDSLLGAAAAPFRVMLHESVENDGVASMVHRDYVPIPVDETIELEPGGLHIMIMGLADKQMKPGDVVDVILTFERAGEVPVPVEVISRDQAMERLGN